MSQMATLRTRIKTVTKLHRTTSAMRLIAMSLRGRLKRQEDVLQLYRRKVLEIQRELTATATVVAPVLEQERVAMPIPLIIVSSQKGLCGSFNEQLFRHIALHQPLTIATPLISVGGPAQNFIRSHDHEPALHEEALSITNYAKVASRVSEYLIQQRVTRVLCATQYAKSFFIQIPHITTLNIPAIPPAQPSGRRQLFRTVHFMALKAHLTGLFHASLIAEQAARFLSMDNATRNAENLLSQLKLDYNKLRQGAVTRELIELSSDTTY